jgi:hypothetical protein
MKGECTSWSGTAQPIAFMQARLSFIAFHFIARIYNADDAVYDPGWTGSNMCSAILIASQ